LEKKNLPIFRLSLPSKTNVEFLGQDQLKRRTAGITIQENAPLTFATFEMSRGLGPIQNSLGNQLIRNK